jgi:hypothetical protein
MLLLRTALLTLIMILIYPITSYSSVNLTYATTIADTGTIPTAEVVYSSESMKVPQSVGTFR